MVPSDTYRAMKGSRKAQDEPAIFGLARFDDAHAGYPTAHGGKHLLEAPAVMFEQVVGNQRQIVSPGGQMFGKSILLAGACFGDMEVGNMPVLDHQPEGTGGLEAFELAKPLDGQNIGGIEFLLFPGQLLIRFGEVFFVVHGRPLAVGKVKEVIRRSERAALVTEYLTFYQGVPLRILCNPQ